VHRRSCQFRGRRFGHLRRSDQSLPDGSANGIEELAFVRETDFALRGMDVDVEAFRVYLEVEDPDGKPGTG